VRTTLTLDDDVAAKLKSLARRSGRAFREVVNDTLRKAGLMAVKEADPVLSRIRPMLEIEQRVLRGAK